MVALTAASRQSQLPVRVMMASPLLSGEENLVHSFALLARGGLQRDSEFTRAVDEMTTLLTAARSGYDAEVTAEVVAIADRLAPRIFNDRTVAILGSASLSGQQFTQLLASPCLATCLSWLPQQIVPWVTCPVLILYASHDVQAPAHENLAAARTVLGQLEKNDWEVRELVGLNHAFQHCTTGMPDEYESIDHVMADDVVAEVAAWIRRHCPPG